MSKRNAKVWLFNCADTFSGNPKWLFLYVNQHRPDIEAWWICDSKETAELVRSFGFRATTFGSSASHEVQARAGVFVVNQVKEQIPTRMRGVTLLNLWHGVGVKNIERGMTAGYLQERIAKKYIRNNTYYHENQLFLVSSPMMEKHFKTQIGLSENNIVRGGYPQNVYPQVSSSKATFDHDIRALKGLPSDARIAVYAPTPRRHQDGAFLLEAFPDIDALAAKLEQTNTLLIFKIHPHMTSDPTFVRFAQKYETNRYLHFWNNDNDIYEIFNQIDLAIVDYSSILYDMLAGGVKNVIRYVFDYDNGNNDLLQEGFDYKELSVGSFVETFAELLTSLENSNEVEEQELSRINELFWSYSDEKSMETIVARALEFQPEKANLPRLYSFDIFDTLIRRRAVTPESIFASVRDRLAQSPAGFPRHLLQTYVVARQQAEFAARENRRKRPELVESGMLEIQFEDIFEHLALVYGLSDAQVAQLMQWEIEAEIGDTLPVTEVVDQLKELHSSGETIVLISDMYLPYDVIKAMLAKADPVLAELPLFLSSQVGVQKTTRKLFIHVYNELNYDFDRWIHTGDNPFADAKMPKLLGITTRAIPHPTLDAYETQLVRNVDTYDSALFAALLRERRVGPEMSDAFDFAYRHVALYLVPYVEWVLRDSIARGYETLYFVSRDGHHMRRIADAIIEAEGYGIRTKYVYGSRVSWRLASQIDEVSDEVYSGFGSFAGAKSLQAIGDTVRLTVPQLIELVPGLERYSESEPFSSSTHSLVLEVLKHSKPFSDHLLSVGRRDRDLVNAYLDTEIDYTEKFAFVEYWGRGYTQDCLVNIVQDAHPEVSEVPFYYARSIYPTQGASVRHKYTNGAYSMLFIEAIFANLPYGTTKGFKEVDGQVVPIVEPRQNNAELHEALEKALPEFAKNYCAVPFQDRDSAGRAAYAYGIWHFRTNPSSAIYTRNLAPLRDSVELGGVEREFAPPLTIAEVAKTMNKEKLSSLTRNVSMSLARSPKSVRKLNSFIKKHKLRGIVTRRPKSFRQTLSKIKKRIL